MVRRRNAVKFNAFQMRNHVGVVGNCAWPWGTGAWGSERNFVISSVLRRSITERKSDARASHAPADRVNPARDAK
jgi:hypothetical protein